MSNLNQVKATGLSLINPVQHPERECSHTKELELDEKGRLLYCKECGEVIDPIDFIAWFIAREHALVIAAQQRGARRLKLRQEIDEAKATLRIVNEEIKAARDQLAALQAEIGNSLPLSLGFKGQGSTEAKFSALKGLLGEGGL